MPQTSPMVWLILSMAVPLMMTSLFSFFSFNSQNIPISSQKNMNNIQKKNFNWTW